jgi:hypothetical protein
MLYFKEGRLQLCFWEKICCQLKNEQTRHCRYATKKEAIQNITEYIEVFYNRQRRQAKLGDDKYLMKL